ncbi:MAG: class I SAM-dependent methyltransferase [Polyangiaceae bacterium]|nr:class I SAM-dependent methyltransferase [Polyangiaceae bacterium]
MRRLHLVELEDLQWFPETLRDGGTAFLAFAERMSGHGRMLVGPLERALAVTGDKRLVDLCSGGGGPAATMADELAKRGHQVTVTLTDLYPNLPAYRHAERESGGAVQGRAEPVDATAVPADLRGFRTIFNAFHHFRPEQARRIVADAVAKGQPIAVFEVVSRELPMLLGLLITPLTVTLSMPLWRPFRWPWVVFTWLIPVMQLFVLWDGIVSWLRIYSVEELRELVAELETPPGWVWDIGKIQLGKAPLHGSYLIGYPAPADPAGAEPAPV